MAARPLPAHGTYARANGCPGYREPCKCPPCRTTRLRVKKRNEVNRKLGRPGFVDAAPAQQHLKLATQTMTWEQIATATGCDSRNMRQIIDGTRTRIRRSTLTSILALQPATPAPGKYLDATGIRRRIQALRAIGYSARVIAVAANSAEARIQLIANGEQPTVRHALAAKILKVYAELSRTPAPAGMSATRTKNHANAHGWAPPGTWDDDRIDDPAAHPEWTGHCGTDRGWWIHSLNDIPVCPRCETAHQQWKAERAHLSNQERWVELGKARATASNRGATIAADARELFSYGVPVEQAAARLGVTRNHLQQELLRHPEPVEEVAA